jgi:nitroreductase/ferredoxin
VHRVENQEENAMANETGRVVARENCTGCGWCVEECPGMLLRLEGLENRATAIRAWDTRCIHCGHCVAVCPEEAMVLPFLAPEECVEFERTDLPSVDQVETLLRARRSVRGYKPKSVPRETLERLLDTVRFAPSAMNIQNVNWTVVEGPEKVHHLAGLIIDWMRASLEKAPDQARALGIGNLVEAWDLGHDRVLRNAPSVFIAHSPEGSVRADSDCHIALTYLELAAFGMGLGGCWAGYLHGALSSYPPARDLVALPAGHAVHGAMMIGYPKYRYKRIPARNEPNVTWA